MKIEYIKQLEHCYIKMIPKETASYEINMMVQNSIKGLLSCQVNKRNGELSLLYEITSLKSADSLWEHGNLTFGELRDFLYELIHVLRECEKYMLSGKKLCLEPEYIFYNMDTKETFFLYDAYAESTEWGNLKGLMEYLVLKADQTDSDAVELTYQLYGAVLNPYFTIRDIEECLEHECENADNYEYTTETESVYAEFESESAIERTPKEKSLKMLYMVQLFVLVASLIVLAMVICLFVFYELSWQEQVLLLSAAGTGILAAVLNGYSIWRRKCRKDEKRLRIEEDLQRQSVVEEEGELREEKTLFCHEEEMVKERGLQEIGEYAGRWIPVDRMPYIIGKSQKYADLCLDDQCVSRIHARLMAEGNRMYLEDLNSTNGTYLNGNRLEPKIVYELQLGDCIGVGKKIFMYC